MGSQGELSDSKAGGDISLNNIRKSLLPPNDSRDLESVAGPGGAGTNVSGDEGKTNLEIMERLSRLE